MVFKIPVINIQIEWRIRCRCSSLFQYKFVHRITPHMTGCLDITRATEGVFLSGRFTSDGTRVDYGSCKEIRKTDDSVCIGPYPIMVLMYQGQQPYIWGIPSSISRDIELLDDVPATETNVNMILAREIGVLYKLNSNIRIFQRIWRLRRSKKEFLKICEKNSLLDSDCINRIFSFLK
ncbi:hypothetical protein TetV_038 [Tetraselmis virus 1]|uniref:Uncharacterized protein n=1 Tax=Tetraselmis virus 1 TaxID=2060617 RepID=A0A2P0VML4_9VIRU|nr:hypothetical protein QJ968_gp038 [Tetraselmis virus 1]AUF82130.1 hypothetical protein TetV_038 [Tetraselmis virus 1]